MHWFEGITYTRNFAFENDSIALGNGLLGGIGENVVNVMLFAAEVILLYWFMKIFFANCSFFVNLDYIKSSITNAVSKRRVNRCIGVQLKRDAAEEENEDHDMKNDTSQEEHKLEDPSINLRDLAFAYQTTPYVLEKILWMQRNWQHY